MYREITTEIRDVLDPEWDEVSRIIDFCNCWDDDKPTGPKRRNRTGSSRPVSEPQSTCEDAMFATLWRRGFVHIMARPPPKFKG
jgi:hypothetical protein